MAVEQVVFADDGVFPNSALPVLIYRSALAADRASPEAFEQMFRRHHWVPQWRAGIFAFHHYHSTAHECLGVASGHAEVQLGGPGGTLFRIVAGDAVVLPAGVAHKRLVSSPDFLVVGAYPPGQDWDILRGRPEDRPRADLTLGKLPVPESDPVEGGDGTLVTAWRQGRRSSAS
jgi:uncharacterized protein YjlB